jgi:hypothetical protein
MNELPVDRAKLLETETVTLNELFTTVGKTYRVPLYQRDYMWSQEHWDALWEDILDSRDAPFPHYMGALVLQRVPNGPTHVIDGQQRLATIIIVCVGLLEVLRNRGEQDRHDILRSEYVASRQAGSLRWQSKLILNETDNAFFQEFVINLKSPPAPSRLRGSKKRLWDALNFFKAKWSELLAGVSSGEEIVKLFEKTVVHRLAFTTITVENELNAYSVFETLNARSLQLTSTDLLKNYVFSLLTGGPVDLEHAKNQWGRIVEVVEAESLPKFLRQHWNSKRKIVRADRLFRALKSEVTTREHAFTLLDELEKASIWFRALHDSNDELWIESKECRELIRALNLLNVSQHIPLLLACASSGFDLKRIESVLRACLVLFFRHTFVGQRNPSELEQRFNQLSVAVTAGKLTSPKAIWHGVDGRDGMNELYISDEDFVSDFSKMDLPRDGRKAKLPRYMLFELDKKLGGIGGDFETSTATIEHVLPENPGEGWTSFSEEDRRRFVSRFGNYVLLERTDNKTVANAPFDKKAPIYAKSAWPTTRMADVAEWNPEAVRERQLSLAKIAAQVWRIDF